jgi:hypothetical protein
MFALRDKVIATLKQAAGDNWIISTLGDDVMMMVGPGRGMGIVLRSGHFRSITPKAVPVLAAALKAVQKPQRSGDTLVYTSLRSGERISIPLALINHIRVLTAPETRENRSVDAAHFAAAEQLGLVERGDDEYHIVPTDEGKDALKVAQLL